MRRVRGVLVAVALLAACTSDDGTESESAAEAPTDATDATQGGPTLGALVSGTAAITDGTFVWTDYAYDDRGADTEPGTHEDLDAAGGDVAYPDGLENSADLIQTQFGLDDEGQVTVRVVLETLTDPSVPVVVVGFDTDGDPATGAEAPVPLEGLGLEHVAVLRADGAELVDGEALAVTVDPDTNVLEAILPLEPDGATWTAFAAAATDEGGELVVHDLGLLGGEPEYQWQDYLQADLLAGDGAVVDAMAAVPFGDLGQEDVDLSDALTPGFHTYLYESELDLGEGVAPAPEDGLEYRGPYQPYLVWIPEGGPGEGEPMTVFLHGLTQNHLGSVLTPDGTYLGTGRPLSEELHQLGQYARDGLDFTPHNLTVWPLARGEGLRYRGIAEQDVLDVLADASERLGPDPDRIILSGGSMGGIGAFRLGALYPDLFSVNAPLIGLASEDTEPLLGNLWNLPVRQINGAMDPLIPADGAAHTTNLLDELELEYRAWMLDQRGHEAGGFAYDCVFASLPDFRRVSDPREVRYTVDPAQFVSDPDTGLELDYDGAYWISGMEVADPSTAGAVRAVSLARGDQATMAVHVDRPGRSGPAGGDLCGENPDVSTGDTWRERAVERVPTDDPPATEQAIDVDLTNLAAVAVDVAGAGLLAGEGEVRVSTDGPAAVTLTGLEPGTEVTVGDEAVAADADGTATVPVPAGESTVTF